MRPFAFEAVTTAKDAIQAGARLGGDAAGHGAVQFLAGGTTLIDLMKLDVTRPAHVIDINALATSELGPIEAQVKGLRLGALVRMADAAEHIDIKVTIPPLRSH
jgi:xanthine dehydrogenase YagS FAD-binding subunit